MDPILKYKAYHKNEVNINIHKICVPILLATAYALLPTINFYINLFYTVNYLLFDVFSKKSVYSAVYLQAIYGSGLLMNEIFSNNQLYIIHGLSWILQILGHKVYEKNTPAFLDNLYDSLLFAPYVVFLETFFPDSIQYTSNSISTIIQKTNGDDLPAILYFAGLFQKADIQYKNLKEGYNHIFVNLRFIQNSDFSEELTKIANEIDNIECVVGYSFGGAIAKQFKEIYYRKTGKDIHSILISPGGFLSNTLFEKFVRFISPYFYCFYKNDKWYMISQYPLYQNTVKETDTDIFILSKEDTVHFPQVNGKKIIFQNLSHTSIINYINKQKILDQIIESKYDITDIKIKDVSSNISKLIFGGHFYPYHIGLWTGVSTYYSYIYLYNQFPVSYFISGFLFASTVWTLTEYIFHRYLLHNLFYLHHKKHHDYPNKKSIIHTPMTLVVLNWFLYVGIIQNILPIPFQTSYYIFFPLNYLAFEYTHLLSHSYVGSNNIIINAKHFHRQHHFTPDTNYSFVTPFWDYLFGTLHEDYSLTIAEIIFGVLPFYSFYIHGNNNEKSKVQ